MGTFVFRWPYPADHVYVTGTFDDWGKTEKLEKVGNHFEKEVTLPSADHKIMYKFVVDDQWIVDNQAPKEDDGHYNVNNVLLPDQIKRSGHRVLATSPLPPGVFSANSPREAPTVSAGGEGAPLLSKEESEANLARRLPNIVSDPNRPVTRTLPQSDGAAASGPEASKQSNNFGRDGGIAGAATDFASAPVPANEFDKARELRQNATGESQSALPAPSQGLGLGAATTGVPDQEYEDSTALRDNIDTQAAIEAAEHDIPGAFPETPAYELDSYKVNPLPATGHQNTQSSVTTSKEDYEQVGSLGTASALGPGAEGGGIAHSSPAGAGTIPHEVSVQPLPASGHRDLSSSVTTSKEDYDQLDSFGTADTAGAAGVDASVAAGVGTIPHEVSVQPLPASGHADIGSSATTSKEDYERAGDQGPAVGDYSVQPIPATGHKNIESSVTTSKEDYENLGALGVAGAAVTGAGAYVASLFSESDAGNKSLIPESSLPMNPEQNDTLDAGPLLRSAGPGTTTADLASKVPLEPRREAQVIDSDPPTIGRENPYFNSSGPSTITADLASGVPLEPRRDAEIIGGPEAPTATKEATAMPFISSSGPGTTTSDLASQVPIERELDPEVREEKSALESELLSKVPESQATGEPASAAKDQSSYYGLATNVPEPVEESFVKAHAPPEAAAEPSVVAEKSLMEQELQSRVPVVDTAGEPAPTLSAATATIAPQSTNEFADTETTTPSAAMTVDALTDGMTANETVPDTDTSTATTAPVAGELAGGAVVGGAAAAGAYALAAHHNNRDVEPARIADNQKPDITTEAAPATSIYGASHIPPAAPSARFTDQFEDAAPHRSAGTMGQASPFPGVAPAAAAAMSDGTEDPTVADEPEAPIIRAPVEVSEATATEYAPPRSVGIMPGASSTAAAALADGTEDPTLMEEDEEPAFQRTTQHEEYTPMPVRDTTPYASYAPHEVDLPTHTRETTFYDSITLPASSASGTGTTEVSPLAGLPATTGISRTMEAPLLTETPRVAESSFAESSTPIDMPVVTQTHETMGSPAAIETSRAFDDPITTTGLSQVTEASSAGPSFSVEPPVAIETPRAEATPVVTETSRVPEIPAAETSTATAASTVTPKKASAASSDVDPRDTSHLAPGAPESSKRNSTRPTAASSASGTSTTSATSNGEQKKKKKNRLSAMIKRIFD